MTGISSRLKNEFDSVWKTARLGCLHMKKLLKSINFMAKLNTIMNKRHPAWLLLARLCSSMHCQGSVIHRQHGQRLQELKEKEKIREGDFRCATVGCSSSVRAAEGSACDSPHSVLRRQLFNLKRFGWGGGGVQLVCEVYRRGRVEDWEREIRGS